MVNTTTEVDKYDALLERLKEGGLTEGEVSAVAEELRKQLPETDKYTLLYIVGRAGGPAYRGLVENHLQGPDDMLARLALWILCWYWQLTADYTTQLITFIRGVAWDGLEECRRAATSIAGEYLRTHTHPDLLHALVEIYENGNEEGSLRLNAYYAIADAMGRDWHGLPPVHDPLDLDFEADPSLIEEAKDRLLQEWG